VPPVASAAIVKEPLAPTGGPEDGSFGAKAEPAGVFPKAEVVPGVEVNALHGEVVPKGVAELNVFDATLDDRVVVVLLKTDFGGSGLGTPNTDVLPKAFGVVARLENADCAGCNDVEEDGVQLNGLEDTNEVDDCPKADGGSGLGALSFVSDSEPLCCRKDRPVGVA
jgi:hypothetical protein